MNHNDEEFLRGFPSLEGSGVRRYRVANVHLHETDVWCDQPTTSGNVCASVVLASDHDAALATLSAERDAARKDAEHTHGVLRSMERDMKDQRDALTARVAQLEDVVRLALGDLTERTDFKSQADRLLYIENNLRAALRSTTRGTEP